eukprot:9505473-Alexandrium_andersonii.AAC.1
MGDLGKTFNLPQSTIGKTGCRLFGSPRLQQDRWRMVSALARLLGGLRGDVAGEAGVRGVAPDPDHVLPLEGLSVLGLLA